MAKAKAQQKKVIVKEDKNFTHVYIMGATVYYAKLQEPVQKYKGEEGEMEYSLTAFVDADTKEALLDLPVNKGFAEVGVDKIKKGANRGNIKYPTDTYEGLDGMFGFGLNLPAKSKKGKAQSPKVVDKQGADFDGLLGNGTIVNLKCMAWKNEDGEYNLRLSLVHILDLVPYEAGGEIEDDILGVSYEVGKKKPESGLDPELEGDDEPPFDKSDESDDEDY